MLHNISDSILHILHIMTTASRIVSVDRLSFACAEISGKKLSCPTRGVNQHVLTPGFRMSLNCTEHSLTFSSEGGKPNRL
jgi:hypothetical protein